MTSIPALLRCIPTPTLDTAAWVRDGAVVMSVEEAQAECAAYTTRVHTFLHTYPTTNLRADLLSAIDFAMTLFHAENYTGELPAAERAALAELYTRFHYHRPDSMWLHDDDDDVPDDGVPDDGGAEGGGTHRNTEEGDRATGPCAPSVAVMHAYLQRLLMCDGEMPFACLRFGALLLCAKAMVYYTTRPDRHTAAQPETEHHTPNRADRTTEDTNNRNSSCHDTRTTDSGGSDRVAIAPASVAPATAPADTPPPSSSVSTTATAAQAAYLIPVGHMWRLRVLFSHQRCLQHRAHSLFRAMSDCLQAATANASTATTVLHRLLMGHVLSFYRRRESAAAMWRSAVALHGLQLTESSMMGVRTRWQQQQQVQMILDATRAPTSRVRLEGTRDGGDTAEGLREKEDAEEEEKEQPRVVHGERDGHDLFDRPRVAADASAPEVTPLGWLDKALILALGTDIRNNNPHHGLTRHHSMTYVERVVADPQRAPFVIASQTLLQRARLECRRNRVQERSFLQMGQLVEQFAAPREGPPTDAAQATTPRPTRRCHGDDADGDDADGNDGVRGTAIDAAGPRGANDRGDTARHDAADRAANPTRLRAASDLFYAVLYPSIWELKTEYADLCREEHLTKTALHLYEQTLQWDKIIACCRALDKRRRAECLARRLIAHDAHNPLWHIALGEATRQECHLWTAWALCGHKMAAPMRALATLALDREQYDKVVTYFDAAVAVNPLFGGDWFALGFASLKLRRWSRGAEAFTRVCQIDPDDAWAWNNLALIMLREQKLRPAWSAMRQALRRHRRDWRMWQNYVKVGCALREVHETTHALGVAVDLAPRGALPVEPETMTQLVDNALAYMRGTISGQLEEEEEEEEEKTGAGLVDGSEEWMQWAPLAPLGSYHHDEEEDAEAAAAAAATEEQSSNSHCNAVDAEEEGTPGAFFRHDESRVDATRTRSSGSTNPPHTRRNSLCHDADAAPMLLRQRYAERLRALFHRLLTVYVNQPAVYRAAARWFGYMDGPMAAYGYRIKELRACRQQDQWQRTPALFAQTVHTLRETAAELHGVCGGTWQESDDATNDATGEPTCCGRSGGDDDDEAAEDNSTAACTPRWVRDRLRELYGNVRAVLEVSAEHMEHTAEYAALRQLAASVREDCARAEAALA